MHTTSHLPYDATEDSVALAAPYDLTCAASASVTHRLEVWLLLFVDGLVVMWIVTSVWFVESHTSDIEGGSAFC